LVAIDVGVGRNPRERRRADRLDPVAHHSTAGPSCRGSRATPHRPESNLRRSSAGIVQCLAIDRAVQAMPVARGEFCLERTFRCAVCPTTASVQRALGAAGRTARSSLGRGVLVDKATRSVRIAEPPDRPFRPRASGRP
jgi:hypothetical protein